LGVVPWTDPTRLMTAVVQIEESIFMNMLSFGDAPVPAGELELVSDSGHDEAG